MTTAMSDNDYPRILTIEMTGPNNYTVRRGDRFTPELTWDEMLGQVAYVTCPSVGGQWNSGLFTLATMEEYKAAHLRMVERIAELDEGQSNGNGQ